MKAFIGAKDEEIAFSKLIAVPRFLRFNQVKMNYRFGSQLIVQKCDLFRVNLSSIKATLNDSNVIEFSCKIIKDQSQFQNHSTLIEHIRLIVSICDSSRGYSFRFCPFTDHDAFGNAMSSILEIPAIVRSSSVYIGKLADISHPSGHANANTQLPVETISNWLHQESHAMEQKRRHRRLWLTTLDDIFQDAHLQEMCDFLKQVSFYFQTFCLKLFAVNFAKRLQNF